MTKIDDAISHLDPKNKQALEHIREVVLAEIPEAEESIGYGMPVMRYKKRYLLGFSAFKHHLSIFPGPEPIEALANELREFKTAKGTVQFTPDNPIPDEVLRKIIARCKAPIDAKF